MRIVHLSVSDKGNGAHLAGYRLHKALQRIGCDSTMFVKRRLDDSGDNSIQVYQRPGSLFFRVKSRAFHYWRYRELARFPKQMEGRFLETDRAAEGREAIAQMPPADVIYIHAADNFIDYYHDLPVLAGRAHVVFVLHDIATFSGGCTYDLGCGRFTARCGACPIIFSNNENDPTRRSWERKHAVFSRIRNRLHFLALSQWIAMQAKRSSLIQDFPVEIIPNSIDTVEFSPTNRSVMREFYGIPKEKFVVGFLGQPLDNVFKGYSLLARALDTMPDTTNLFLLTGGRGKPPVDIGIPHLHLGNIYDARSLCAFHNSIDVLAVPSISDNLPQVVLEAMACGTPVVAFNTGGIPEMVRNNVTGLVVPEGDTKALGDAIADLLHDSASRARMGENARKIALEEYTMEVQAERHADYCARLTAPPTSEMRPGCVEEPDKLVGKA